MNPAELEQARALFALALEQTVAERPAFLDQACQDRPELRANVEALLSAADRSADASASPTVPHPADQTASETNDATGSTIGPYKLLQLIGEGGFGSVFMAEQQHPVRRRVALKIIKLGMDTRAVIARFDAERQALAMMDHPNIAKILDAGETATGRPYFVMELVKGIPITQYCDMNKLPTEARLNLFVAVCNALQHAHQKGIIHRDIKPSNILVTLHDGNPVPKLIDFGIAKATQARLTEMTLFTEFRQFIGTPAYMSPEQAEMSGLDVDTRSDIYSLGVLLYELLTGTTPFDPKELRAAGYAEIQRIIREVDPPRPSTRLSTLGVPLATIAANRDVEPRKLSQMVRGELDWIVMKALEKDRTRRYESAGELARDVGRHLEDQPVEACPPSAKYRLHKFLKRNRALTLTSAAIVAVAVAATTTYIHGISAEQRKTESALTEARNQRAEAEKEQKIAGHQRDEAQKQEAIAASINAFLANMLASADPQRLLGDKVTVVQAIEVAAGQLDSSGGKMDPVVEALLRTTIGMTLCELSRYNQAEPHLRRALEIHRRMSPAGDVETARSLDYLATVCMNQNRSAEAEALLREALGIYDRTLPKGDPEIANVLSDLANVLAVRNQPKEAEELYRRALQIRRERLSANHPDLARNLSNLAALLVDQNRLEEAEQLYRQSLEIFAQSPGAGLPDSAGAMSNLAVVLRLRNKPDEAETMFRAAIDGMRRVLPPGHPNIAASLAGLGELMRTENKLVEAEKLFREALAIDRGSLPADHPNVARELGSLARVVASMNRPEEAEGLYREALAIDRKSLAAGHPALAVHLNNLALLLGRQGKLKEAEKLCREALDIRRAALPADHPDTAETLNGLGNLLMRQNRPQEAEPLFLEALAINRRILPRGHPYIAANLNNLGVLKARLNKGEEAEKFYREAIEIDSALPVAPNPAVARDMNNLANLLNREGRADEAAALRVSAATASEATTQPAGGNNGSPP
ncbi:MAG TPA: serine/threonine-protein kinase [Tepidisphaeraceae bacterium]|jgi:serine/threonine protein kinase/Tfp pilus assembly protein PilF|nr:serine/threonine-protein kinase [Tepidisphaeraceae bacterium]